MDKRIKRHVTKGNSRTGQKDQYTYKAYVGEKLVATVDILPSGKRVMWVTDEPHYDRLGLDALNFIAEHLGEPEYNPNYKGYAIRQRGIPKKKGAYLKVSRP